MKKTRFSMNGKTEYQIEYYPLPDGVKGYEYKVRRGARGTWTDWFTTDDMDFVLGALGFNGQEPTWLTDFYFESYFGRGEIRINQKMYKFIARRAGYQSLNTYLYARMKQVEPEVWVIPATALENEKVFNHLKDVIQAHL
jgi:hypothetical protein